LYITLFSSIIITEEKEKNNKCYCFNREVKKKWSLVFFDRLVSLNNKDKTMKIVFEMEKIYNDLKEKLLNSN